MKIEITLDKKLSNDRDCDFFHYNCGYELAKCEYGTFRIDSLGELKYYYTDENGEELFGDYGITNDIVKNNTHLAELINNGYDNKLPNIKLDMNNWFSIEFFDNNGYYVETYYADSVYGSISEALDSFKEDLENEDIIIQLKEDLKEYFEEQLNYLDSKLDMCAYGKEELQEIEELKYKISDLERESVK